MNFLTPCPNNITGEAGHECPACAHGWILSLDGEIFAELLLKRIDSRMLNRLQKLKPRNGAAGFRDAVLEAHKMLDEEGIPAAKGVEVPGINSQLSVRLQLLIKKYKERLNVASKESKI
jgi:hypothetical protein